MPQVLFGAAYYPDFHPSDLSADRMFSSRQEPFLVTETNAQSIGPSWTNQPAYDGQWRQAAWALVSRGARMIEYWQWRSPHFGTETYWGGVLPHSGRPGTHVPGAGPNRCRAGGRRRPGRRSHPGR